MGYLTTLNKQRTPEELAAAGVPEDPNRRSDESLVLGMNVAGLGHIGGAAAETVLQKLDMNEAAADVRGLIRSSKIANEERAREMTPEGRGAYESSIIDDGQGGQRFMDDPVRAFRLKALAAVPSMAAMIGGSVFGTIGVLATGGVMALGETADAVNAEIDGMSHDDLYKNSEPYRRMIDDGMPEETARNETREMLMDILGPIAAGAGAAINLAGPEAMFARALRGQGYGGGFIKGMLRGAPIGGAEEFVEGTIPAIGQEYTKVAAGGAESIDPWNITEQGLQEALIGAPAGAIGGGVEGLGGPRVRKPRIEPVPVAGPDAAMTEALGGAPPATAAGAPPAPAAPAGAPPPTAPAGAAPRYGPDGHPITPDVIHAGAPAPGGQTQGVASTGSSQPITGGKTSPVGGKRPKQNAKKGAGGPTVSVQPVPAQGVDPTLAAAMQPPAGPVPAEAAEYLRQQQSAAPAPGGVGNVAPAPAPPAIEPAPVEAAPAPPVAAPLPTQVTPEEVDLTGDTGEADLALPSQEVDVTGDAGEAGVAPPRSGTLGLASHVGGSRILPDISAQQRRQAEIERAAARSSGEARGTRYTFDEASADDPKALRAWQQQQKRAVAAGSADPIAVEAAGIRGARGTKLNIVQAKRLRELFLQSIRQSAKPATETVREGLQDEKPKRTIMALPGDEGMTVRSPEQFLKEAVAHVQDEYVDPINQASALAEILDAAPDTPEVRQVLDNSPVVQATAQALRTQDTAAFEAASRETVEPSYDELIGQQLYDLRQEGEYAEADKLERWLTKEYGAERVAEIKKARHATSQDIEAQRKKRGGTGEVEIAAPEEGSSLAAEQEEALPEQEQAGAAETEVETKARTSTEDKSDEAFKKKAKEHTSEVRKPKLSAEEQARLVAASNKATVEKVLPTRVTEKEEKPAVKKVKAAAKSLKEKKEKTGENRPKKPAQLSETQRKQQHDAVVNEAGTKLIHWREQAREELRKNGPESKVYQALQSNIDKMQVALVENLGQDTADSINKMVNAALAHSAPRNPSIIKPEALRSYRAKHGLYTPARATIPSEDDTPTQVTATHATTISGALDGVAHNMEQVLKSVSAEYGDRISRASKEFYDRLIPLLRQRVGHFKFYMLDDAAMEKLGMDPNVQGRFFFEEGMIIVRQSDMEGDWAESAHTIIHEVTHAAFFNLIHHDQQSQQALFIMRTLADRLMRNDPRFKEKLEYGFTNEQEFVAEAFSNPLFRQWLAMTPMPKSLVKQLGMENFRNQSMWAGFVNLVRKVFRLPLRDFNMLEGVLHITEQGGARFAAEWNRGAPRSDDPFLQNLQRIEAGKPPPPSLRRVTDLAAQVGRQISRHEGAVAETNLWLRTVHQKTQLADQYWPKGMALNVSNIMERARIIKRDLIEKAQRFMLTEMHQLQNKYPEQFARFQEIAQAATAGNIHPDVPLNHPKNKHVTDAVKWDHARRVHARLYPQFQKLPQEFKNVWAKSQKYYTDTQNQLVEQSVKNMVEQVLGRADAELANRMLDGTTTEEDNNGVFKTNRVLRAVSEATELRRLKGAYFPQMRHGDHVVMARYKLPKWVKKFQARGKTGKLTRAVYEFTNERDYKRFMDDMDKHGLHVISDSFSVDTATGKRRYSYNDPKTGEPIRTKKGNIKQFKYAKGDPGTHEVWRARVQDQLVSFYDSKREMAEAADELRADKNYHKITTEKRENLNFQTSSATSLQIRRVQHSMEQTKYWEGMSGVERASARQGMMELALNHLSSTAPLNRARPRRNVIGASKDMVRSAAEYISSTSGALAKMKTQLDMDKAFAALRQYMDEHRYEGDNRSYPRTQILQSLYNDAYDPGLAPTKSNRYINALLSISFIDKLVSPAFHIINGTQPWMVTLPVVAGRHGYAKSTYHLGKAYQDMGFFNIIASGVKDTIKAAQDMMQGTTDYMADIGKRLAKQPDGKELTDMLVYLAENGLIDKDSGMEVTELIGAQSKAEHLLHRVDHIIRQFGTAGEVANRVASAIAAYRLERAKGASIKDAQVYAQETVANTQGNYSSTNAPQAFRHPLARIALQFKKYAQLQYFLLAKLSYTVLKGATPQEKWQAAKSLTGLLAMHVAMAGMVGLPTEPIKYPWMLLATFLPMPSWDEVEQMGTELAQELFGEDFGDAVAHGLPRLAGADVSSRVGLNSLLTFGTPRSDKANDVTAWVFNTAIGAPGGLLVDWVRGASDISEGNFKDAAEKMIPVKAIADAIRGYRRATEGKYSARGEQTAEGYGALKGILQGIGFKPASEAVREEKTAAFFKQKGRRESTRRDLMNRFLKGEAGVRKEIIKYNAGVPPDARITMKDLKSLAKRKKTDIKRGYYSKGIYGGKMNKDLLEKYIGQ